jgi:hypothetical protein
MDLWVAGCCQFTCKYQVGYNAFEFESQAGFISTKCSGGQLGHRPIVSGGPALILVAISVRAAVSVERCYII